MIQRFFHPRLPAILLASVLGLLTQLSHPRSLAANPTDLPFTSGRPGAYAQDELEQAARRLREAAEGGNAKERERALAALLVVEKGDVSAVLVSEYAQASESLRRLRDDAVEQTYALDRLLELEASLKARVAAGSGDSREHQRVAREVVELQSKLASTTRRRDQRGNWLDELHTATGAYFGGLAAGARKKAEKTLWDDAEKHPDLAVRLGAIEVLGIVAPAKAVEDLVGLLTKAEGERTRVKRELVKLEREVREFEARLQEEAEETGGRPRSGAQYERLRQVAAENRTHVIRLAFVVDAAAEAAGRCLARTDSEGLPRTIAYLLRARKKAKQTLRLKLLDVLRGADSDAATETLLSLTGEEEDPLLRAELLDALALRTQLEDLAPFFAALADANWHVRSRAAAGLARLRAKAAVPLLIERLAVEEGRTRSDVIAALGSLTAKNFRGRVELWRAWWSEEGAGFEVVPVETEVEGSLDVEERVGVTFFGIRTESQRVLFVLDLSGSMLFPMHQRSGTGERPAGEGEENRLSVAKRELVKAIGGLRDGARFNLLFFASSVWSWDEKVKTMDPDLRSEALGVIDRLGAVGGTNVYGALQEAFDQAGVEEEGEWNDPVFDTIYFLSDGKASVGVTQVSREILDYAKERNRSAGIVIHTIGLSSEQDAYFLRSLAEENGGNYVAR